MASKFSPKQKLFVAEYLRDLNATQAAIRAGYSQKTARSQGQRLLTNVDIQNEITKAIQGRADRTQIDADHVLRRFGEIDSLDIRDILNDNMTLKPLSEWPDKWCRSISGLDIQEIKAGTSDPEAAALIKKIKWPDKIKTLEMIGKHVDVQAFLDRSSTEISASTLRAILGALPPDYAAKVEKALREMI